MTMDAQIPVEACVPHRGAMRLIDRLLCADDALAVAEVDVPLDGLFVRDGTVPAWVGIEYMAQTVAAWAGARAMRAGGRPRIGFLIGSRRYEARCASFRGGSTLRVEARCELMADNGLGMFDCRIFLEGVEVASARLSVFEPDDPTGVA
jgi:predicted hotdog family 3-hydroxylacyl-ACP dehydratase